jgi:hypothetical protein
VAASLFKLWLRELQTPVVPTELYNQALAASKSPAECLGFVRRLPTYNKRVLVFVISFIQLFIKPEIVEITKMTTQNLGELSQSTKRSKLTRYSPCLGTKHLAHHERSSSDRIHQLKLRKPLHLSAPGKSKT